MEVFNVPIPQPRTYDLLGPAPGMRNSTDCVARRYLSWAFPQDERFTSKFRTNVGNWGYVCANAWIEGFFYDEPHSVEVPIRWDYGLTCVDLVVLGGEHAGQYEIKSTSKSIEKYLVSAEYKAAQRQMARQKYLSKLDPSFVECGPWNIAVVCKSGNEQGIAFGPFVVYDFTKCLDGVCRVCDHCINRELVQLAEWVRDGVFPEGMDPAKCSCYMCFPNPRLPFPPHVVDDVHKMAHAKRKLDEANADLEKIAQHIERAVEVKEMRKRWTVELGELRNRIGGKLDTTEPALYEAPDDGVALSVGKTGRLAVRKM